MDERIQSLTEMETTTSIYHQKPDISIARKVYDETFLIATSWEESANSKQSFRTICRKLASCPCTATGFSSLLIGLTPIVRWLPKYCVKKDLLADINGGVTVGIMHIPQGNRNCLMA